MAKYNIRLDICTICNLNCPLCDMRLNNYGKLKAGYTKFETFKKFIDDNNNLIKRIEISSAGEPFLNPDLVDILKYAYENNIIITCNNASNFNSLDDTKIKALVDYQVKEIAFACDGATQASYEKYRRNGNIETIFNNVRKIQEYKKIKNSEYPKLTWQFVLMESSEDDVELALKIAKELDVDIFFKLTWDANYKPKNPDKLKLLTGLDSLTRSEFKNNKNKNYKIESKCRQLWSFPQINWDGRLLGCCFNREPFNINVFEVGIKKALQSEQFVKAKLWLSNRATNDGSTPCMNCINGNLVVSEGGMDEEFVVHQERIKYGD